MGTEKKQQAMKVLVIDRELHKLVKLRTVANNESLSAFANRILREALKLDDQRQNNSSLKMKKPLSLA